MTRELWQWTAIELAHAIRKKEVSSVEATLSCLDRMAAVNPSINAVVAQSDAAALQAGFDAHIVKPASADKIMRALYGKTEEQ